MLRHSRRSRHDTEWESSNDCQNIRIPFSKSLQNILLAICPTFVTAVGLDPRTGKYRFMDVNFVEEWSYTSAVIPSSMRREWDELDMALEYLITASETKERFRRNKPEILEMASYLLQLYHEAQQLTQPRTQTQSVHQHQPQPIRQYQPQPVRQHQPRQPSGRYPTNLAAWGQPQPGQQYRGGYYSYY